MTKKDQVEKIWRLMLLEEYWKDGEECCDAIKRMAKYLVEAGIGDSGRFEIVLERPFVPNDILPNGSIGGMIDGEWVIVPINYETKEYNKYHNSIVDELRKNGERLVSEAIEAGFEPLQQENAQLKQRLSELEKIARPSSDKISNIKKIRRMIYNENKDTDKADLITLLPAKNIAEHYERVIHKERLDVWKTAHEQFKFDFKMQELQIKKLEQELTELKKKNEELEKYKGHNPLDIQELLELKKKNDELEAEVMKGMKAWARAERLEKELRQCQDCSGYCLYLKQEIKKLKGEK